MQLTFTFWYFKFSLLKYFYQPPNMIFLQVLGEDNFHLLTHHVVIGNQVIVHGYHTKAIKLILHALMVRYIMKLDFFSLSRLQKKSLRRDIGVTFPVVTAATTMSRLVIGRQYNQPQHKSQPQTFKHRNSNRQWKSVYLEI